MNKKGGKGYFYSMGARDQRDGRNCSYSRHWPRWAHNAYYQGWANWRMT